MNLTETQIDYIKSEYSRTQKNEIAKKLGISLDSLYLVASNLGITRERKEKHKRRAWTEEEDMFLIDNYDYMPNKEIMNHITDRSKNAIEFRAKNLGLSKKDKKNHDYFSVWSNNMAYFLGLLYADGCVNQIDRVYRMNLSLHKNDGYLLDKLKSELNGGNIYDVKGKNNKYYYIHSKKVISDLGILGVTPAKTYTITLPNVPQEHLSHFVRGYFDGDGTITDNRGKPSVSFTSSSEGMLIKLKDEIYTNTKINSYITKAKSSTSGKDVFYLRFHGINALDLCKWMYQDSEIKMTRKYDRYLSYENKCRIKYNTMIEFHKNGKRMTGMSQSFVDSIQRYIVLDGDVL